jgi:hypothetical protein
MSRRGLTFALAFLCIAGAVPSEAAVLEPSGTTLAVNPSAAVAGSTGQRVLEVMGPVFMGDRVDTGPAGQAQIKFRDDTRLVVGPNSSMIIDSFVFNENDTVQNVSMHAAKGAFRFITGTGRKQAYSISTPAATIGIRGTRFDFFVRPDGETLFALFEGQARLCDRRGRCVDVVGGCSIVVAAPAGGLEGVSAGPRAAALLASYFPYVESQAALRPDFRVDTAACAVQPARRDADTGRRRDIAVATSSSPN